MRGEGSVIATLGRVSRSMSCACRRYAFRQAIEQIVPPTMLLRTHVVREQACCFRPLNLAGVILFVSMFLLALEFCPEVVQYVVVLLCDLQIDL